MESLLKRIGREEEPVAALRYTATGKRKCAVARVCLTPGEGKVVVNGRPYEAFFPRSTWQLLVLQPFEVTETRGKYDVTIKVAGGGLSGQAGAVRHGITKSLLEVSDAFRPALKKMGLITRDPRVKERKKYGQKGARKRFQYSKR
jgi:small subunit ribosomal protein S9